MKALFPYEAETRGIIVRVSVSYQAEQSEPAHDRWFWAYHIRIENQSRRGVQLLTRHWIITDGRGQVQQVRGGGVVGDQPLIGPGDSFDYVSGCPLDTASGTMEGSYGMVDELGASFDVAIPRFLLHVPVTAR
ncbi:Co2+/Mg2+ efflux protein ApaG [Sphingomonas morindae]|uniref:Protein ApaG n=1 Tax=Sphingomonas morindae TaxID=1541170 RepID=A0ABY4XA27_9SPHN|nr:Co2+/Mg2+ efflux protein ApaG [Sphingomonas morindae]USI73817.1 Co2+/Mg2+ efflux protein ApaG [Sphingomonas morindae]